ncbi:MAG: LamG-like jellyroll fold domain-containing protein [Balneola sp.]
MKTTRRKNIRKTHNAIFKASLTLTWAIFITGLVAIPLNAQSTWFVSPAGSNSNDGSSGTPWLTIQFALNSAVAGDTVKVMDDDDENTDDYTENITITKNLILMRADTMGANPQVKAANSSDFTIRISSNNVVIDGLDIYGAAGFRSGIIISGFSNATVQNCRIGWSATKNNARGFWVSNVTGSTFKNNEITSTGEALFLQSSITSNTFLNNVITTSGPQILQTNSSTLTSNNFEGNSFSSTNANPTAITFNGSDTQNTFFNNTISGSFRSISFGINATGNRFYLNDITGPIFSSSTSGNFWNSEAEKIYTHDGGSQFVQFLGNFYSSHSTIDADANGLADASFSLPGNEPVDAFPLAKSRTNFELVDGRLINIAQVDTLAISGNVNIPVLKVTIVASGVNALSESITEFTFNTDGTNLVSDVDAARLYRTGQTNAFSTDSTFGSLFMNPNGSFSFSDSKSLEEGSNYYWLAYNVSSGASSGNVLDAEVTQVTIGGGAETLSSPDPVGSVPIFDSSNEVTGLSLSLDGVNDYLNVPHSSNIQFVDSLTIEFWIKGSTSSSAIVLEKGTFNNSYYINTSNALGSSGGSYLLFGVHASSNNGRIITAQEVMDGNWHHFAVTVDSELNVAHLYVDGVLSKSNNALTANPISNNSNLSIGSRTGVSALAANIDELRLWSTIRTPEQIRQNMFQKLVGDETGLAAYYSFDEFSVSTITDASPNSNNGTLANGAAVSSNVHPSGTFITGGEGWRILSSPFGNSTYGSILEPLWTQGFTGADYSSGTSNVYVWDESDQQFVSISDADDIPPSGTGFLTHVYDDVNFDDIPDGFPKKINIEEKQNHGTVAPMLSFTDTGTLSNDGWNLIGNPYGASIDWDASTGWDTTNIDATIYIWDDSQNGGLGSYLTWNGITGTLDNGIIAPWQGFWVKANAASPSLMLNDSTRTGGGFLIKKAPVEQLVFTLQGNERSSKTILVLNEQASIGKDALDAYKLTSLSSNYLSLYTILEEGSGLDINSIPKTLGEAVSFDLGIDGSDLNGEFTVSWGTNTFPKNLKLQLIDRELEITTDLSSENEYKFQLNKALEAQNIGSPKHALISPQVVKAKNPESGSRFMIRITTGTSVSDEPEIELPTSVELQQNYPNPFNPSTSIGFGLPQSAKVTLEVFDVLGRKVATLLNAQNKTAGRHTINFDALNLASGMYIYRLQAGSSIITKKLTLIK